MIKLLKEHFIPLIILCLTNLGDTITTLIGVNKYGIECEQNQFILKLLKESFAIFIFHKLIILPLFIFSLCLLLDIVSYQLRDYCIIKIQIIIRIMNICLYLCALFYLLIIIHNIYQLYY